MSDDTQTTRKRVTVVLLAAAMLSVGVLATASPASAHVEECSGGNYYSVRTLGFVHHHDAGCQDPEDGSGAVNTLL